MNRVMVEKIKKDKNKNKEKFNFQNSKKSLMRILF